MSRVSRGTPLKVCGPGAVQTLRGRLLEREVALVFCGEAHEEAIDLTRKGCITEAEIGWSQLDFAAGHGYDPEEQIAEQANLTVKGAKDWAERVLEKYAEDSDDSGSDEADDAEGILVFEATGKNGKGTARLFPSECERDAKFPLSAGSVVWELGDLDDGARAFNKRRLRGENVPVEEHDALIEGRKQECLADGTEFLDDWLLRQVHHDDLHVQVLLEATVSPKEVELHVDSGYGPAPAAHACIRQLELDSDADSEDDDDPDDGTGAYADFFHRRLLAHMPAESVRGVDPRDLGDAGEDELRKAYAELQQGCPPVPEDAEATELDRLKAELAVVEEEDSDSDGDAGGWKEKKRAELPSVPSWEGFFGAAAELLYYSPQVKADFTPLLARCLGSEKATWQFFEALYFRTIPEAAGLLMLDQSTRPMVQTRSLAYQPPGGGPWLRRPAWDSKIPVRALPLERYLKAKGSSPPRTWASGMAERLCQAGCSELVAAARKWFRESVEYLLTEPKEADEDGDYFAAWLRACHRKTWDDIDRSDPAELRRREWVPSVEHPKSKKHRHKLKDIRIPGISEAFAEFAKFDPDARTSTARERVLAQIIVDAFQLRLVDVSMVLAIAEAVLAAPTDRRVVVLVYGGEDHTRSVCKFWRSRGFTANGLAGNGCIGKSDWEEDEPRALEFPPYLQDIRSLFPVPK